MKEIEYQTLRNELNENRKYVFERPLVILTAALIGFQHIYETPYVLVLPSLIIFLFIFNLHFTCNRLNSSARIMSYIRLYIEKKESNCFYWETFLDKYRKDKKGKSHKRDRKLRYYPLIFWFHMIIIIFLLILEIFEYMTNSYLNNPEAKFDKINFLLFPIFVNVSSLIYLIIIWKNVSPSNVIKIFDEEDEIVEKYLI